MRYSFVIVVALCATSLYPYLVSSFTTPLIHFLPIRFLTSKITDRRDDLIISSKRMRSVLYGKNKYSQFSKASSLFVPTPPPLNEYDLVSEKSKSFQKGTTIPIQVTPDSSDDKYFDKQVPREFKIAKIDPSDPFTFGFCRIGTITNSHGVRGEVVLKVFYS